jgi:uncharacterized protein (DUF305 family)
MIAAGSARRGKIVGMDERRGPSLPALVVFVVACMFVASAATYWWDHRPEKVGAVDVGFFDDMTTHHHQAIAIASTYTRYGTDILFRADAAKIIFSQSGDIRQMQRALTDWDREGTPDVAMEWMGMHTPQAAQPGMATARELAALDKARGHQLDDLFSALMINHHNGGLHMATYASTHAKTKLARKLANVMARDQRFEIIDLNAWREHLGLGRHEPGASVALPAT